MKKPSAKVVKCELTKLVTYQEAITSNPNIRYGAVIGCCNTAAPDYQPTGYIFCVYEYKSLSCKNLEIKKSNSCDDYKFKDLITTYWSAQPILV